MLDFFSKKIQKSNQWKDWHWQLQNRLTSKEELEKYLKLSNDEIQGLNYAKTNFSVSITPYVLVQMDRENANCPIRKQYIPSIKEQHHSSIEFSDPCNEDEHSPVPGIVHRYPDRVLFLVTDICGVYCRYCTRSRLVGNKSGLKFNEIFSLGLEYIKNNPSIRDVLISGGDPLLLGDKKLDFILQKIRAIPHVEIIRIGTRIPIVLPQRITDHLCKIFKKYHPFYISLHVNHPKELNEDVLTACNKLSDYGIPLGSQSVLIKGVNDSSNTMRKLLQKLLYFRIRPYYLYQCDLVKGTSHLRTSLSKGMEIMRNLRGFTTGYAIPTYVLDAPYGGGKIPIEPSNVISQKDGLITLRNWAGKIFDYHEVDNSNYEFSKFDVQDLPIKLH